MEENKMVNEMDNLETEQTEEIRDGSSAASGIVLGAVAIGAIALAVFGIKNGVKWIAKKREEYQAKKESEPIEGEVVKSEDESNK